MPFLTPEIPMAAPDISPIVDHPVLRIAAGRKLLCAADLHIGVEAEMASKGVHLPSQTYRMEEELLSLREEGDLLVILGDVKHQVPLGSPQEHMEIPRLMRRLAREFAGVHVVRGNHDGGLEDLLPREVPLHPASGLSLNGIGFVHGHTWPAEETMANRVVVMAHNHPALLFVDGLGRASLERCWLRCRFKEGIGDLYPEAPEELIIMPAMNRGLSGSPVNERGRALLGPLLSKDLVDLDDAKVYLIDGIYLGRLADLRVQRSK